MPSNPKSSRKVAPARKAEAGSRAPASTKKTPVRGLRNTTGNEFLLDKRHRAGLIIHGLKKLYPQANCALKHQNAFELLIATILSAQCTDETVNKVTPILFAKYPGPADLATARPSDIESIVHATGFFRQKTRSIQATSAKLLKEFAGQVPHSMEALLALPGVARKTANVVLGTAFGQNDGIVVDTHVGRLALRLGLTWSAKDSKDAVKIEQDLMQVVPREHWTYLSHALIWHGRGVCSARKPRCDACTLAKLCPSAGQFP